MTPHIQHTKKSAMVAKAGKDPVVKKIKHESFAMCFFWSRESIADVSLQRNSFINLSIFYNVLSLLQWRLLDKNKKICFRELCIPTYYLSCHAEQNHL